MTRPDPGLPRQQNIRSALRVIGPVLLVIGLLLTAVAMVDFFSAFGSFSGAAPRNFWMAFIGIPLIGVGAAITRVAFLGPATRYVAGEVTPALRDTLGALGIGSTGVTCAACGATNADDSRFCNSCGRPLEVTCPSCGESNAAGARFCDGCGKPLNV